MASEEPDHHDPRSILQRRDQPIAIALDVEHDPAALKDARSRMRCLHILRVAPQGKTCDGKPYIVLRPSCSDTLIASMGNKIALHDLGADNDHWSIKMAQQASPPSWATNSASSSRQRRSRMTRPASMRPITGTGNARNCRAKVSTAPPDGRSGSSASPALGNS